MSAIQLPYSLGSVTDLPAARRCFLTASAWSRNQLICFWGSSGKPAYLPVFQIPTRIWKNPTESASPKLRFFMPDSTRLAITGSSGGNPRFCAWPAIHAAICSRGALSPGYASGAAAAIAAASTAAGAPATGCAAATGCTDAADALAFGCSTALRNSCESDDFFSPPAAAALADTAFRKSCESLVRGASTGAPGTPAAAAPAGTTAAGTPGTAGPGTPPAAAAPGTAAPGTAAPGTAAPGTPAGTPGTPG